MATRAGGKAATAATAMNAGEKANASRRGDVTAEMLTEFATALSKEAAAVESLALEMQRRKIETLADVDGATQFDRGASLVKSFRKHVASALATLDD